MGLLQKAIRPVCTVTSFGVWQKKNDLKILFPDSRLVNPILAASMHVDNYIGWGHRPSGRRAIEKARKTNSTFTLLEDGFLRSYYPGNSEPSASYILDSKGIYFDASSPSTLEGVIADCAFGQDVINRASSAISEIRRLRLSKYNNAPLLSPKSLGIPTDKPFVLLLDQVPGDASIAGAMANANSFEKMLLHAAENFPQTTLVIRGHPAAKQIGYLEAAARNLGIGYILKESSNLWPLLEESEHVLSVSSHAGFEALMADKPVTLFGMPYYGGWGLTNDMVGCERRTDVRELRDVFAAAYIQGSTYLDIHTRQPSTLENAIDALGCICESRSRNRSTTVTVGFSKWKRKAVEPFLMSSRGRPIHSRTIHQALKKLSGQREVDFVVWGSKPVPRGCPEDWRVIRMEDGFIRSVGLGASFRYPNSLVRDPSNHIYYDARGSERISKLVNEVKSDPLLILRAQKLQKQILEQNVSKYMIAKEQRASSKPKLPAGGQNLKILVVGQVEDDASVQFGSPDLKTNTELIRRVRTLYPTGLIAYREHPDVVRGYRKGKADRTLADVNADDHDIIDWLKWCDRVETMTSLTGFEALLRGKQVGVHGWPFYAGWGLTKDRLLNPSRGKATIDELVGACLLLYPDYIHPKSRMPCTPEVAVEAMANAEVPSPLLHYFVHPAGKALGKLKALLSMNK